ncbi:MAG: lipid-A-disaccharide synthase [Cellvibrionaceae bacterium]
MKYKIMKIGIVSGEMSGDILGAGLIKELKIFYPDAQFVGIGGEKMIAQGLNSLFAQDRLAVMGIVEPLKRLPELLSMRRQLYIYFTEHQFDVVIGIDSPSFNTGLEERLKKVGIKTVHYVSPSVWAWRQGRIKQISRAVDLMLTLLPFENAIYEEHNIPVKFVGHPLADKFSLVHDQQKAKSILSDLLQDRQKKYAPSRPLLACLPGSRGGEIKFIGPVFWESIALCCQSIKNIQVIVPAANSRCREQIEGQLKQYPSLPITIVDGLSHEVMAASDAVLLASGTTALEAMLLKRPMVVAYKMAALSYYIISTLLQTPYIALPNLLANKLLVPELVQGDATVANISSSILQAFATQDKNTQEFTKLHQSIKRNADMESAKTIHALLTGDVI